MARNTEAKQRRSGFSKIPFEDPTKGLEQLAEANFSPVYISPDVGEIKNQTTGKRKRQ